MGKLRKVPKRRVAAGLDGRDTSLSKQAMCRNAQLVCQPPQKRQRVGCAQGREVDGAESLGMNLFWFGIYSTTAASLSLFGRDCLGFVVAGCRLSGINKPRLGVSKEKLHTAVTPSAWRDRRLIYF